MRSGPERPATTGANDKPGEPMPGNNNTGAPSTGPLARTKVCPNEVGTTCSTDGTGQAEARNA